MAVDRISLPESWAGILKPARMLAEITLVALIAVLVARAAWLMLAPSEAAARLSQRPLPSPVQATEAGIQLNANRVLLLEANPFDTSEPVDVVVDAPETQLNLRLAGLLMSTAEGAGSAQITTPDNRTQRFVVGDEVLDGVTLERILSDRVILNRNGESETLMLGGRGSGLMVIGDGSQANSLETDSEPAAPSEGQVQSARQLMQTVGLTPYQRNDRLYGYGLSRLGSEADMRAMGLQDGDILVEINGVGVSELNMRELQAELANNGEAILQVERGGKLRTVRLKFGE